MNDATQCRHDDFDVRIPLTGTHVPGMWTMQLIVRCTTCDAQLRYDRLPVLERKPGGFAMKYMPGQNPGNAVEFINEDGSRYAWSESNCQYESVPQDGASFTLLRKRLERAEQIVRLAALLIQPGRSNPRRPELVGADEFLKALLHAVRGYHFNDQAVRDSDQENANIVAMINELRAEEGSSVTIVCDNPDFNDLPDRAVDCSGEWTNGSEERFGGDTLAQALAAAVAAKRQRSKKVT